MATVPLQICNDMDKCGKIFYCFIFSFLSPLFSFFIFSSLSLSGSLSLLPIPVSSLFDQFEMFSGSDDGVAPTMIARSATLDLTHAPAIWVDLMVVVGCGLWAMTVAVVVGCGAIGFGSRWRSGLGYGGD